MQQSVGKMERIKTAIRIVIGLVQVLKDMPKIQKQQDKYPAEWEEFGYFTPSLGLIAPCIPFSYIGLFLTNSFVVPLLLMGCVALDTFAPPTLEGQKCHEAWSLVPGDRSGSAEILCYS